MPHACLLAIWRGSACSLAVARSLWTTNEKLAILVGGGPAPGINSVIGAATIRACLSGVEVARHPGRLQVAHRGRHLARHPADHRRHEPHPLPRRLDPRHLAREPDQEPRAARASASTRSTASASACSSRSAATTRASARASSPRPRRATLRVVHVPKTIDNDLDLPQDVYTFGFQTARHIGVEIVKNLMVDAKTTSRWYFVVAMGRKAGHLALGIGKAAGATLTLIPEEFAAARSPLSKVVDTLAGAIIKRLSHGRTDGVAVLAEGLVEHIRPSDIEGLEGVERDAHGHIRIAEVDFGNMVKAAVKRQLAELRHQRDASSRRTSATSSAAPTRSRSTWSTRATSATAPRATSSRAAPRRSSASSAAASCRCPSRTSWIR